MLDLTGAHAQVRTFESGEQHSVHRDNQSRISIILRGGVAEDSAWGATRMAPGDVIFKSREVAHEDRFGPEGAAIFSILFEGGDDCPFRVARLNGAWLVLRTEAMFDLGSAAVEAAAARDAAALDVAIADLLAWVRTPHRRTQAPRWLDQIYDALLEASLASVDIAAFAKSTGRHPVTVSREFRRSFGMSITDHAARQSVRRAIAELAAGETDLAEVALAAGFYDQSHMNRVFKRITARTPGAHRAALAATVG